jgi:hypothetical protein
MPVFRLTSIPTNMTKGELKALILQTTGGRNLSFIPDELDKLPVEVHVTFLTAEALTTLQHLGVNIVRI